MLVALTLRHMESTMNLDFSVKYLSMKLSIKDTISQANLITRRTNNNQEKREQSISNLRVGYESN